MLISQNEIGEMIKRYPEEKPVAFNYIQAREDFIKLLDAYNGTMKNSCGYVPAASSNNTDENKYLVFVDNCFVRDAQMLPGNSFADDFNAEWVDCEAHMLLGEFTGNCKEQVIAVASELEGINPIKLVAYQIVD